MKQFAKKHLRFCAVVLYIALICTCAFSGVLSYYSVIRSADASARVSLYAMTMAENTTNVTHNVPNAYSEYIAQLGKGQVYQAASTQNYTVSNTDSSGNISEVAMTCYVKVELSSSLPKGTTLTLTDKTTNATYTISGDGTSTSCQSASWTFPADTLTTRAFTVTLTTDNTYDTATGTGNAITVNVSAVSVQS